MTLHHERGERNGESVPDVNQRLQYEWSTSDPPSIALIEAIASATGRDPLDMPPLSEEVDPDALDALVTTGNGSPGTVEVTFTYDGTEVHLDSKGVVEIQTNLSDRP